MWVMISSKETYLTLYEQNWEFITDQMTSSLCIFICQAEFWVESSIQIFLEADAVFGSVAVAFEVTCRYSRVPCSSRLTCLSFFPLCLPQHCVNSPENLLRYFRTTSPELSLQHRHDLISISTRTILSSAWSAKG